MNIEVGKLYQVEIDDCCVIGSFESVLKSVWDKETEEWIAEGIFELDYGTDVLFENGVELSCMGGVTLKEKVEEE